LAGVDLNAGFVALLTGGSVSAVNGMQYDQGARADVIASAIIVTMFALMATVLGVFAMRRYAPCLVYD
jgi:energy-converting hydrogenase Eha subunit C